MSTSVVFDHNTEFSLYKTICFFSCGVFKFFMQFARCLYFAWLCPLHELHIAEDHRIIDWWTERSARTCSTAFFFKQARLQAYLSWLKRLWCWRWSFLFGIWKSSSHSRLYRLPRYSPLLPPADSLKASFTLPWHCCTGCGSPSSHMLPVAGNLICLARCFMRTVLALCLEWTGNTTTDQVKVSG